jgi:hypothetical protein
MKAGVLLLIVFTAAGAGSAHAQAPACPVLEMTSEFDKVPAGREFHFVVTVKGVLAEPTYAWSVSAGEIVSGQGRSVISVRAPAGSTVTASVQVGGFPPQCDLTVSKTVEVAQ